MLLPRTLPLTRRRLRAVIAASRYGRFAAERAGPAPSVARRRPLRWPHVRPGRSAPGLLALIAKKPSHGYELIRSIEEKFGGVYAPSPGAVYPTLTLLEEQDLIRGEAAEGGKKLYAITSSG